MEITRPNPLPSPLRLLRPREAALLLGVCPRTLRTMTASGAVAHVRIGKLVRYRPDDLRRVAGKRARDREAQQLFRSFKAIFGRWAR
jgi:excisionase family DNA binding protein